MSSPPPPPPSPPASSVDCTDAANYPKNKKSNDIYMYAVPGGALLLALITGGIGLYQKFYQKGPDGTRKKGGNILIGVAVFFLIVAIAVFVWFFWQSMKLNDVLKNCPAAQQANAAAGGTSAST